MVATMSHPYTIGYTRKYGNYVFSMEFKLSELIINETKPLQDVYSMIKPEPYYTGMLFALPFFTNERQRF